MQARSETRKISYAWLRWIAKLIQIQIYLGFRIHDCGTLSGLLLDSKTSGGTSPSIFSDCLFNHDALRGSLWLLPLVRFLLQLSRSPLFLITMFSAETGAGCLLCSSSFNFLSLPLFLMTMFSAAACGRCLLCSFLGLPLFPMTTFSVATCGRCLLCSFSVRLFVRVLFSSLDLSLFSLTDTWDQCFKFSHSGRSQKSTSSMSERSKENRGLFFSYSSAFLIHGSRCLITKSRC
jgi:hypothetical protein